MGRTSLARLLAAALGRARAWVPGGELNGAAAVHGTPSGSLARIVEELRRVGVRSRMFVLDEVDRLDKRVIAREGLLPWQLAQHGLTADQVRVTDEGLSRR